MGRSVITEKTPFSPLDARISKNYLILGRIIEERNGMPVGKRIP
jgi:hypothetical protein